jgi:hypothetical protein
MMPFLFSEGEEEELKAKQKTTKALKFLNQQW